MADDSRTGLMDGSEDVALDFGEEDEIRKSRTTRFRRPLVAIFQVLFRVGAFLAFMLCMWFSDGFIANFVIITILLSLDFWTVKNITGRLLVGLRWWNRVDEDGNSHWVYESLKGPRKNLITTAESQLFWFSLIAAEVVWIAFFFVELFTFKIKWLLVVCMAIMMNTANVYGYVRCKVGAKAKLSGIAQRFLGRQVLSSMISSATKSATTESTET